MANTAGIVTIVDVILDEVKPSANNADWCTMRFIATENYKGTDIIPDFPNILVPIERKIYQSIKKFFKVGEVRPTKFIVSMAPAREKYSARVQFDLHMPSLRVEDALDREINELSYTAAK